jgi:hypothetical protein
MKKSVLIIGFLFLLMMFSVLATEEPAIVGKGAKVGAEALDDKITTYNPVGDDGKVNFTGYKPFVTKGEERLNSINEWLDSNVGWMRYIFWMRPQISWLFAFNLYIIFFFLTLLFFNAEGLWFFIEKKSTSMLFGLAIFVIFSVSRLYVGLAKTLELWRAYLFGPLYKSSIWLAIILIVITVILIILAPPLLGKIIKGISVYRDRKKQFKRDMESSANSGAIKKLFEGIKK